MSNLLSFVNSNRGWHGYDLIIVKGMFKIVEQVIRYNLLWCSLRLLNRKAVYEKRKLFQTRLCKYNLFKNFKYSL